MKFKLTTTCCHRQRILAQFCDPGETIVCLTCEKLWKISLNKN